jgi:hypothetical protein
MSCNMSASSRKMMYEPCCFRHLEGAAGLQQRSATCSYDVRNQWCAPHGMSAGRCERSVSALKPPINLLVSGAYMAPLLTRGLYCLVGAGGGVGVKEWPMSDRCGTVCSGSASDQHGKEEIHVGL